jgi:ribosomal protein S6--L-glutamate ligase
MHLCVITSPESWYLADLRRAAGDRHEVTTVSFRQLTATLDSKRSAVVSGGVDLTQTDCVLVRTMPPGSLEQIVFRMDALGRLAEWGTPVINPPRALETAVDKYLALAKLQEAGLAVPKTLVCQTVEDAMEGYRALGSDIVVKPLFGSEGRGMMRIVDESLALRAFKTLSQLQAVLYLQQFIPHEGYDLRLLLIGGHVLAMKRRNEVDWRTNVACGATPEPATTTEEMVSLARRAADAIGAPLAGVDLLPGRDGKLYTIEVNAVPGWRALAATLEIDVAQKVLEFLESIVVGKTSASTSE